MHVHRGYIHESLWDCVCTHVVFGWIGVTRFRRSRKNTHRFHLSREMNVEAGEEVCDDFSPPPPPCPYSELRTIAANASTEVERKRSRRWRGCRWGWCEDENWFIAALMRSGMPGDSGCSPSPCCGNIKRNRGPPSLYNCCRDLSKSLRSLCRNLCNPDCCYPAYYF